MKYVLICISLLLAMACEAAAQRIVKPFSSKTFTTTVNRTDTSAQIDLLYHPFVEIATNTIGTDSLRMVIAVDYLLAGRWVLGGKLDTIKYGPATSANKAKGTVVLATHTASPIPGAQVIRIRNTLIPFRMADSTSATSYTQIVTMRK